MDALLPLSAAGPLLQVVLHKSIPVQIRQLILVNGNDKELLDGFVGGLTSKTNS